MAGDNFLLFSPFFLVLGEARGIHPIQAKKKIYFQSYLENSEQALVNLKTYRIIPTIYKGVKSMVDD
ncbi:MAG: hypothetical protein K5762_04990 [Bacilli bacterium]|nr:hypothetical protein [Bacilli bacterium]